MKKIRAVLVKPLDGAAVGSTKVFDKVDFDRLEKQGAVTQADDQDDLDQDDVEATAARARENGWVAVETHDAVVAERDQLRRDLDAANKRLEDKLKPAGRAK